MKSENLFFTILGVGTLILIFGAIYFIHQTELSMNLKHQAYKNTCLKLDPMIGDTLRVDEGPYRNTDLIVVDVGEETVVVVPNIELPIKDLSEMQKRFTCEGMKVVRRANGPFKN